MILETRVGYMAVSILKDLTLDYIEAFTINNKYLGELHYLIMYQQFERYLNETK